MSTVVDGKNKADGQRYAVSIPDYMFDALAATFYEVGSDKQSAAVKARAWVRVLMADTGGNSYAVQQCLFEHLCSPLVIELCRSYVGNGR